MPRRRFTDADLNRWAERGIITADQRDAIVRDLEAAPPPEDGLTLTTLLYYSGGLLVLVAYAIFLGFQWEAMNEGGRLAISAASFAFFAAISFFLLRDGRFQLPGELLQIVAVAVVPLLTFAFLDVVDLWPQEPTRGFRLPFDREAQEQYQADLTWARMAIGGVTLLVATGAFRWRPSPFLLVAAAAAATSFLIDATIQIGGPETQYDLETGQTVLIAIVGAVLFAGGVAVRGRTERDYAVWLYVMGISGLAIGLGVEAFPSDAAGWGTLWMIASLGVLAFSVPLQERLLAAAGILGALAYLGKLVFDVFESANAALVLIVIGLLILGAGLLYQRFGERLWARQSG